MNRAFSLTEVLVYVLILGMLSAIIFSSTPSSEWWQSLGNPKAGDLIELSAGDNSDLPRQACEIASVTSNGITVLWHGHTFLIPPEELTAAKVIPAASLTTLQKMERLANNEFKFDFF